jgi:hypothetical protein
MIEWNIVTVLTGATIAILASFVYSFLTNAFLSGGRFRSKEEAIFIYLSTAFLLGILTPVISSFWMQIVSILSLLKILGLLIIVGNAVINQSVKRWKHITFKTILIYLVGILLLIFG